MIHVQRTLILALFGAMLVALAPNAWGVPMWSRRYNVPCSLCHSYPSLQLTSAGLDFFRKGHRFDTDTFDKDLSHLLSAHIEGEYDFVQGAPTPFTRPDLHLHAGGAVSEHFSAYADANVNNDFETIYLQATKSVGKDAFVTARAGKLSPTIIRNYANGIMASASNPLIITDTTLGPNPFTPARDSYGISGAGGWKSLYFEGGIINGDDVPGQVAVNRHKDFYASGEYALPDGISGVGLYTHRGGYDIAESDLTAFDRYDRTAIFANFTRSRFRIAGAYLTGRDSIATQPKATIRGFYVQGDLNTFARAVPFVRYDSTRTDTGSDLERQRKATVGVALSAFETDVSALRVAVEAARLTAGQTHTNSALINLLLAF